MGCWNGTCGVSQLPIGAGSKVKTFLLLQSEFAHGIKGSGSCYNTEFFRPWFFPVTAEYNDYGSIENIQEDWNTKYMLETFQRWLAEGEVKILGDEDCEINSPDIESFKTLDDVFDCVERGALVHKNHGKDWDKEKNDWVPSGGYLKIAMFMVLENVFNDLVKESNRFMQLEENDYYLERQHDDRELALEAINKARSKAGEEKTMDELHGIIRDIHVDKLLGNLIEEHYCFKHYKTILYKNDVVSVDDFMKAIDSIGLFATAMTYLRKLWFPQTGQGSQSEELSFNKVLCQSVLAHITESEIEAEKNRLETEEWQRKFEAEQAAKKAKKPKKEKK